MAQGMAQANRNNAMKMKADGMPADFVSVYPGVPYHVVTPQNVDEFLC